MSETAGAATSGNEPASTAAAAADGVPTRKTKLVQVPEASILMLMWQKARAPRWEFPMWKPRPNDTRVELIRAYEKAAAVMKKRHQLDDDLILQYINNGCAYAEVEIRDDDVEE